MNDYLIKGMAANNEMRFMAAYTRATKVDAREEISLSTKLNRVPIRPGT